MAVNKTDSTKPKQMIDLTKPLSDSIVHNTINIMAAAHNTSDLLIRETVLCGQKTVMLSIEGMINMQLITELIFSPLNSLSQAGEMTVKDLADKIQNETFMSIDQKTAYNYQELFRFIMSGHVAFLFEGLNYAIIVAAQGFQIRSISETSNENNISESREAFVESVRINMSMVRRRMKSPTLKFELMNIGERSNTDIALCYLTDKAPPKLVEDIKGKLKNIKLNTILGTGYIQSFVADKRSMFTEVGLTERPDVLLAKIYDGRVCILVDGTPYALVVPYLFLDFFQTMDDYSQSSIFTVMMRWIKIFAFFMSMMLPGLYVAFASFNPELFTDTMLLHLSVAQSTTPFPLLVECILLHIIYEIMREAGLRLPKPIGHAVSIVGGLVIGDAAVSSGLVGAPLIMVVALTGIFSFIVPNAYQIVVIMRFAFLFAGGFLGIFGVSVVLSIFLIQICSLNAYGVPFTSAIAPLSVKAALRDVFLHRGWRRMEKDDVPIDSMQGVDV